MDRPEIIRIIEADERAQDDLLSFQFGYMTYEMLLHRLIARWHEDRLLRSFVDEAQQIIDDSDWRF